MPAEPGAAPVPEPRGSGRQVYDGSKPGPALAAGSPPKGVNSEGGGVFRFNPAPYEFPRKAKPDELNPGRQSGFPDFSDAPASAQAAPENVAGGELLAPASWNYPFEPQKPAGGEDDKRWLMLLLARAGLALGAVGLYRQLMTSGRRRRDHPKPPSLKDYQA